MTKTASSIVETLKKNDIPASSIPAPQKSTFVELQEELINQKKRIEERLENTKKEHIEAPANDDEKLKNYKEELLQRLEAVRERKRELMKSLEPNDSSNMLPANMQSNNNNNNNNASSTDAKKEEKFDEKAEIAKLDEDIVNIKARREAVLLHLLTLSTSTGEILKRMGFNIEESIEQRNRIKALDEAVEKHVQSFDASISSVIQGFKWLKWLWGAGKIVAFVVTSLGAIYLTLKFFQVPLQLFSWLSSTPSNAPIASTAAENNSKVEIHIHGRDVDEVVRPKPAPVSTLVASTPLDHMASHGSQDFWDFAEKAFKEIDSLGILGGAATLLFGSILSVRKLFKIFAKK
jgi:hypothetical protein